MQASSIPPIFVKFFVAVSSARRCFAVHGRAGCRPEIAKLPQGRNYRLGGLHPAALASFSEQNHRSPFCSSILVLSCDGLPGTW